MARDSVANFIRVVASTGYTSSATLITLVSAASLPAASFNMVWWNATVYANPADDPNVEIVRVTNISGSVITVTRAQEGTAATNKNSAGDTYWMILAPTAKTITDLIPYSGVYVETPSGAVDGSNLTYTTVNTIHTILGFFSNGQFIHPYVSNPQTGTTNYTFTGNTITFTTALSNAYGGPLTIIYI